MPGHAPEPSAEAVATHAKHREPQAVNRTFTVAGPRPIQGKCKGETVVLCVTPEQADALILAGHVVEKSPTIPAAQKETEADEPPAEPVATEPSNRKGK